MEAGGKGGESEGRRESGGRGEWGRGGGEIRGRGGRRRRKRGRERGAKGANIDEGTGRAAIEMDDRREGAAMGATVIREVYRHIQPNPTTCEN